MEIGCYLGWNEGRREEWFGHGFVVVRVQLFALYRMCNINGCIGGRDQG